MASSKRIYRNTRIPFASMLALVLITSFCTAGEDNSSKSKIYNAKLDSSKAVTASSINTDEQESVSTSRQNAITISVEQVSPAIVGINVMKIERYVQRSLFDDDPFWQMFFPPRTYQQKVKSLGSGFIISPDGYILTNEHVIHNASEIVVTTTSGKQYNAKIAGSDYVYDVALLKIDGSDFPYVVLGNSDDIIIGEWAIALGNPFGLFDVSAKPTVTVGVISATNMDFKGDLQVANKSYTGMIQTDAAINGGNSGGPLVNSLGQCIGINTIIISGSSYEKTSVGIGFAIPINRVKRILPDLKKIGRIDRISHIGIEIGNINTLVAKMLGISPGDGVIISRIRRKGPAWKKGIKVGDVIVGVNGYRVHNTREFQQVINSIDIINNSVIKFKIYRNERLFDASIEIKGIN
ncbi:trypsin-like peptidase domain-containing protein [bacterium]|nr:trypsin-like peptidase domain-containing protein [bacterium]